MEFDAAVAGGREVGLRPHRALRDAGVFLVGDALLRRCSWRDTPSGNTIGVAGARLSLALQDPRFDMPTQGDRSPFLDTYLRQFTKALTGVGEGTFPLALAPRG